MKMMMMIMMTKKHNITKTSTKIKTKYENKN